MGIYDNRYTYQYKQSIINTTSSQSSFNTNLYPYVCLAIKLDPLAKLEFFIDLQNQGTYAIDFNAPATNWRSVKNLFIIFFLISTFLGWRLE